MATRKQEAEEKTKLRIRLKAYDHKVIDESCRKVIETAARYGVEVVGPIPLPTEIHKYTVKRAAFIHKRSREQFETGVHKRIIDLIDPTPQLTDALMNLDLPIGVGVEIKI